MMFSKSYSVRLILVTTALLMAACGGRREKSPEEAIENAPFRVDTIGVDSVSSPKINSLGLAATKNYYFRACLQDSVLRGPIPYTHFLVSDGKTVKDIRSDVGGCLLWTEEHPVDLLQTETLFKISRTIIGNDAFSGSVTIELAYNPWNDGAAITDLRKTQPSFKMSELKEFSFTTEATAFFAQDVSRKSRLNAATLALTQPETNFSQYKVNKLLALRWARNYKLAITPAVLHQKLDGSTESLDLPTGKFRVQVLIVKFGSQPPYSPKDVIAGFDQVVENSKLNLHPTVTLTLDDPSLVLSKSRALVKVSPLGDAQNQVQANTLVGVVAPMKGNEVAINLEPQENTFQETLDLASSGKLANFTTDLNGLSMFMKNSGFKGADVSPIDFRDLNLLQFSGTFDFSNQVAGFLDNKLDLIQINRLKRALCFRTFENEQRKLKPSVGGFLHEILNSPTLAPNLSACYSQPDSRMVVSAKDFVLEVTNSTPRLVGFPQDYDLKVSSGFDFAKSDSTTSGEELTTKFSLSGGLSFSGQLPIIPIDLGVGVSRGYDRFVTKANAQSSSSSTSASMSTSQSLSAQAETFDIDVVTKKCLLFSAKPEYRSAMSDDPNTMGFIVCAANNVKKTIRETYYIIDQALASTVTRDGDSPTATKWRMKIRGSEQFELFKAIVSNPANVLEFQKRSETVSVDTLPQDFHMMQSYPGMASQ